jgi:Gas vesicle synthesis protein GvpL/GvpF
VLYVYAFVPVPASVPDVPGIGEAELRAHRLDGLEAIVSEHNRTVEVSDDSVLAHARVVEAVAAANDAVLPARFGGMHADGAALHEAVDSRPELQASLERVRGCVELGLRVFAEAAPAASGSSGADYMRARLEQRRKLERLSNELHEPLARLSRDSEVNVGATPRLLLTGAYLVEREQVESFRAELAKLQKRHPELGVVCTGPWPPYSFVIADGGGS